MDNGKPTRVNLRLVQPDDYRIVPASDAAGGPTPYGDIIMHLFVQYPSLPAEPMTYELTSEGGLVGPISDNIEGPALIPRVDCRLQVGVLMSPIAAQRIGQFLLDQVRKTQVPHKGEEDAGN